MRRIPQAIIAASLLLLPNVAGADELRTPDSNDTRGRLDIASAIHAHATDGEGDALYQHAIRTFFEWRSRLLGRDATEIDFWFSIDDDDAPERVVYVKYKNGRLRAELNEYEDFGDGANVTFIRRVEVTRLNKRALTIFLAPGDLGHPAVSYDWQVSSFFLRLQGSRCRQWYRCRDWIPSGNEYITHEL